MLATAIAVNAAIASRLFWLWEDISKAWKSVNDGTTFARTSLRTRQQAPNVLREWICEPRRRKSAARVWGLKQERKRFQEEREEDLCHMRRDERRRGRHRRREEDRRKPRSYSSKLDRKKHNPRDSQDMCWDSTHCIIEPSKRNEAHDSVLDGRMAENKDFYGKAMPKRVCHEAWRGVPLHLWTGGWVSLRGCSQSL